MLRSYKIGQKIAEVKIVQEFKYLGLNIDSMLSLHQHKLIVNKIVNCAQDYMPFEGGLLQNLQKVLFLHMYIFNIIEYILIIWSVQIDTDFEHCSAKSRDSL